MNLQTHIPFTKNISNLIDYNSKIILLGSCFSDNIGQKLSYHKFESILNPFGILFHPKAIETLMSNAVGNKIYSEGDVFLNNEQWHCCDAHSKLSNTSKNYLINQLNEQIDLTSSKLKRASHIIITFGTAWVYRDIKTDSIVANCHKVPQIQFDKEILSVATIEKSIQNTIDLIEKVNQAFTLQNKSQILIEKLLQFLFGPNLSVPLKDEWFFGIGNGRDLLVLNTVLARHDMSIKELLALSSPLNKPSL